MVTPCIAGASRISMKWESFRTHRIMAPSLHAERNDVRDLEVGRAPYVAPELRALGDIREMTLGGSLGTGDSGNAAVQKF